MSTMHCFLMTHEFEDCRGVPRCPPSRFRYRKEREFQPLATVYAERFNSVECLYQKEVGKKPEIVSMEHVGETIVEYYGIVDFLAEKYRLFHGRGLI
jgi:hypothetical protein